MGIARQIAILLGVAILIPMLVYNGFSSLSTPPKRADYNTVIPFDPHATPEQRAANAEKQKAGQKVFAIAQTSFAARLMWTAAPLGCAAMLVGGFLPISAIGTGLIFGGLFTATFGNWTQWALVPEWQRFVMLLLAGAVLVVIGLRKTAGPGGGRDANGGASPA